MSKRIDDVLLERTDISQFLVHLTREYNGKSAKDNLISILEQKKIVAYDHHCLFSPQLKKEKDKQLVGKFKTVSFTETPLDKIHLLTDISGRSVQLQPYGVVFKKRDIRNALGNPAFYVYERNDLLIQYLRSEYKRFVDAWNIDGADTGFSKLGCLVNIVKKSHDFHWEREWRVRKGFKFKHVDVFAVIAPTSEHDDIRDSLHENFRYCVFIDSKWSFEQIVNKLAVYIWNELGS